MFKNQKKNDVDHQVEIHEMIHFIFMINLMSSRK